DRGTRPPGSTGQVGLRCLAHRAGAWARPPDRPGALRGRPRPPGHGPLPADLARLVPRAGPAAVVSRRGRPGDQPLLMAVSCESTRAQSVSFRKTLPRVARA